MSEFEYAAKATRAALAGEGPPFVARTQGERAAERQAWEQYREAKGAPADGFKDVSRDAYRALSRTDQLAHDQAAEADYIARRDAAINEGEAAARDLKTKHMRETAASIGDVRDFDEATFIAARRKFLASC